MLQPLGRIAFTMTLFAVGASATVARFDLPIGVRAPKWTFNHLSAPMEDSPRLLHSYYIPNLIQMVRASDNITYPSLEFLIDAIEKPLEQKRSATESRYDRAIAKMVARNFVVNRTSQYELGAIISTMPCASNTAESPSPLRIITNLVSDGKEGAPRLQSLEVNGCFAQTPNACLKVFSKAQLDGVTYTHIKSFFETCRNAMLSALSEKWPRAGARVANKIKVPVVTSPAWVMQEYDHERVFHPEFKKFVPSAIRPRLRAVHYMSPILTANNAELNMYSESPHHTTMRELMTAAGLGTTYERSRLAGILAKIPEVCKKHIVISSISAPVASSKVELAEPDAGEFRVEQDLRQLRSIKIEGCFVTTPDACDHSFHTYSTVDIGPFKKLFLEPCVAAMNTAAQQREPLMPPLVYPQ